MLGSLPGTASTRLVARLKTLRGAGFVQPDRVGMPATRAVPERAVTVGARTVGAWVWSALTCEPAGPLADCCVPPAKGISKHANVRVDQLQSNEEGCAEVLFRASD